MNESFFYLVEQAKEVLQDRDEDEAILIYEVAKLDDEARMAIILAFQILKDPDS